MHSQSAESGSVENDGVLFIEAGKGGLHYWSDLWRYRELLYFLAWRDFLVRYKQAALGISWAVLRPLVMMLVFTLIFGRLAEFPSEGLPYPVLVFAALLPWQLFATAFAESGNSVVGNANLISKVYFPRLIIPVSGVLVSLVDFLISLAILGALMAWYGVMPGWRVLALPIFIILALASALSAGIWVAALNVKYRDIRFVIPFAVQIGLYVSPVGFSSSIVPDHWRLAYALNPMVGVIDGFRWAVSGGSTPLFLPGLALSTALTCLLLTFGIRHFRRTEKTFADII